MAARESSCIPFCVQAKSGLHFLVLQSAVSIDSNIPRHKFVLPHSASRLTE